MTLVPSLLAFVLISLNAADQLPNRRLDAQKIGNVLDAMLSASPTTPAAENLHGWRKDLGSRVSVGVSVFKLRGVEEAERLNEILMREYRRRVVELLDSESQRIPSLRRQLLNSAT
jgi:hypothetical protein